MTHDYRRKIKTPEELREILGSCPRERKVVMCHGTFDIVHPGHVRHLIYAKSKGAVLVASLTCDAHVVKANMRPYIPEEMRAMNLAALEAVDYVVIDRQPVPLENIAKIQPDYFVKGYEYVSGGLHPATAEEKDVVESYGGEMIFTPGDIVYSSSRIIEDSPPSIGAEKLAMLLEAEGLTFQQMRAALDGLSGLRVHVIGDTIVDSLTHTTLIGSNGKTPTFSVRYERRDDYVGGAGIVAKHLRATGAQVTFSTVLGNDQLKDFVLEDLAKAGVDCKPIIDSTRPTTNKNAIETGGYRLLKLDTVDNRTISDKIVAQLVAQIAATEADIVVFSDFRHGIFNRGTIPRLTEAIPAGAFRAADSQVASRWGNILEFKGFDLLTPNEREARFALGDQDTVIRPLGSALHTQAECRTLMLKMGERGSITYRQHQGREEDFRSFFVMDSYVDRVIDPVGAGDALLAYASLAMKSTGSEIIAAALGSMAAAVECERDGNIPVSPADIAAKIDWLERRANYG